nr:hypothetical protein [uncultured Draconibacterium sp.]
MKNLFFLIALLFTVVCMAHPPTEEVKVFKPDKTFVAQANDVVSCTQQTAAIEQDGTYSSPVWIETIETCEAQATQFEPVREVAYSRKYLVNETASRYATELKAENAVVCSTDLLQVNSKSFSDTSMEKQLLNRSRLYWKDNRNTNYGYPLSART